MSGSSAIFQSRDNRRSLAAMFGGQTSRWVSVGTGVLVYALAVGACAVGSGSGETDQGSGASGPATSSQSGSGGAASGGAGSTSSSSGTDTSSSSTGSPCAEMPCKLVAPQCGCPAGEKCTVNGGGDRICAPEGAAVTGDNCGVGNDCVAGSLCLTTSTMAMCRAFCDADDQCAAPGGLCVLQVADGNGGVWPAKYCSENCDPVSGAGCAPANAKCEVAREASPGDRLFTLCVGVGASVQGASCMATADCAAGFGCFTLSDNSTKCLQWCKPNNNPSCGANTTCSPFPAPGIVIGAVEYGVCL